MALNASALQVGASAIASDITHVSFHSGDPGASGSANLISGGRFAVALSATGGNISLDSSVEATGLTALETVSFMGLWTAATDGTYRGSAPRTSGDAAVNAAGEYTITALSIPGSSS